MASQRLPGKVMLDLGGAPLLQRMLERLSAAELPTEIIVATSADASCDPIQDLCGALGVRCYRGHPTDLLDRHWRAGSEAGVEAIARVPSNCPLIDPRIVDRVLGAFQRQAGKVDFASNLHPPSYPEGNDVEVMTMAALETAWLEARRFSERSMTTPYLWSHPERFRLLNVPWETGKNYSETYRWTIDYVHDYRVVRAIFRRLYDSARPIFSLEQIVALVEQEPSICAHNRRWLGSSWRRRHLGAVEHGLVLE